MAWAAVRDMFACAIGWCGQRRSAAEDHAASPTIAVCRRRTTPRRHAALLRPSVRGAFPVERGAGPRGSSAGRGRTRRGRPARHVHGGARDRRFSRGQIEAWAGTFAGWLYVSRRPSGVRSLWDEVQVRGGRPPGEGACGEGGRPGTSTGEARGMAWGTPNQIEGPRGCQPVRVRRVLGAGSRYGRRNRRRRKIALDTAMAASRAQLAPGLQRRGRRRRYSGGLCGDLPRGLSSSRCFFDQRFK